MCIIIYKPEGITLFPDTIKHSFENNPDGAGFAYVENGKVNILKGYFTVEEFQAAYIPHEKKQALLHFRIKTHGTIHDENCHPFNVSPNLAFAHNGVLYKMPNDKVKSDTVLFNELILMNLVRVYGKRILFDEKFKPILEGYASTSKFVFMDNTGQVSIINEKDGNWNSKCWFSNDSYRERQKYTTPYTTYPNQHEHNSGKKKKKPLPELPPPMGVQPSLPGMVQHIDRPWVIGDYLRPTIPLGLVDKGWLGKAMSFYQNGDVELYFPIRQMSKRIPAIYLERVVPQELKIEE